MFNIENNSKLNCTRQQLFGLKHWDFDPWNLFRISIFDFWIFLPAFCLVGLRLSFVSLEKGSRQHSWEGSLIKNLIRSFVAGFPLLKTIIILLLMIACCSESPTLVRHVPMIEDLHIDHGIVCTGGYTDVKIIASDEDPQEELTYLWSATCGKFVNPHNHHTQWWAPDVPDTCILSVSVSDHHFTVSDSGLVRVISCQ